DVTHVRQRSFPTRRSSDLVVLTAGAMECLEQYGWPGNVRELGNLIERLSITCAGRPVGVADLPPRYRPADWEPSAGSGHIAEILDRKSTRLNSSHVKISYA